MLESFRKWLRCSLHATWYHGDMVDFLITELLDASICAIWLERHIHPDGFVCPHCGESKKKSGVSSDYQGFCPRPLY